LLSVFVLLSAGVWIALALVMVGVIGISLFSSRPVGQLLATTLWGQSSEWALTALPLFIWMGEILFRTRLSDDMFTGIAPWMRRLPGRLLHVNVIGSGIFAAVSGSSTATAVTIGRMTIPELTRRGYDEKVILGSLAGAGTLGIMIPPSIMMIVYGVAADVSIARLFIAGVVPGLLLTALFSLYIFVAHRNAGAADTAPDVPLAQKLRLLRHLLPPAAIFLVVMGSIYGGLATPTESAALGVMVALFFVWRQGRLSLALMEHCFRQSARTTGMVVLVIVCALLLNVTLSMLGTAQAVTQWVGSLGLSAYTLLALLTAFYVVLGMFMDAMSMLVLTVPIAVPMVVAVGVDPVWFGIFIVVMCEIALITPPVGMNLFVVQGLRRDGGSFGDVVRGSLPYVFIMIGFVGLLIAWPQIALWLPESMSGG
jgi:tripartite ATP-independent transporter DctM subunit